MTVAALSRARQSTLSRGINAFVQRSHDVGGILPNGPATSWPLHDAAPTTARCSTLGQFQETPGPSWLRLRTGGSRSRRATASDAHLALTPIAPQRKIAGAGAWGYHGQYVAFDGTSFFLAGNGPLLYEDLRAGFLARVSVSDGTVTMLGSMEDAQAVAVDDQCVYWASDSGLFSLSKTTSQTFALDGVPPPTAPDAGVSANPSLDGGRRRRLLLFCGFQLRSVLRGRWRLRRGLLDRRLQQQDVPLLWRSDQRRRARPVQRGHREDVPRLRRAAAAPLLVPDASAAAVLSGGDVHPGLLHSALDDVRAVAKPPVPSSRLPASTSTLASSASRRSSPSEPSPLRL
jgi:hypothetical protein